MDVQLDNWRGDFGNAYTERNIVEPASRKNWFGKNIPDDVRSVCECGANAGHNLVAIDMARPDIWTVGVEPNASARARAAEAGVQLEAGDIYSLSPGAVPFDLVFTSGVLIHVPPHRLDGALSNLYAMSAKYLLAIEYRRDADTMIEYRGYRDMLWAADYGAHYQRLFPAVELIGEGELTEADGFKDSYYWLLRKELIHER
jgi:trans-aconitate methyltransferase